MKYYINALNTHPQQKREILHKVASFDTLEECKAWIISQFWEKGIFFEYFVLDSSNGLDVWNKCGREWVKI